MKIFPSRSLKWIIQNPCLPNNVSQTNIWFIFSASTFSIITLCRAKKKVIQLSRLKLYYCYATNKSFNFLLQTHRVGFFLGLFSSQKTRGNEINLCETFLLRRQFLLISEYTVHNFHCVIIYQIFSNTLQRELIRKVETRESEALNLVPLIYWFIYTNSRWCTLLPSYKRPPFPGLYKDFGWFIKA